ncbi:MAG: endonuclease/exonuclease/phosphatase family protein [Saprospiraceae bacterium]|nr:endonuclease/exonuclease/phosphatase family protein [Lewinella sp.]
MKLKVHPSKSIYLLLLLAYIITFTVAGKAQTATFQVMTFNIRYPNPNDGFNYWPNRKELAASMIRFHEADIVGVQEAYRSQLQDLTQQLPGYKWYGVCRTDGATDPEPDGEFSAIIYRSDRFQLVSGNTFWLSEHPKEVGKAGWDAALPRIVTWAKFRDKQTQQEFFFFNTHFDHMGQKARAESARLIREQIATIAGNAPVILTGDFNAIPTEPPYRIITDEEAKDHLQDALYLSQQPHHGPMGTWTNAFQFPGVPDRRIDYIFVKNGFKVLKHANLSDSWSGRLPSDHLPVLARVELE